MNIVEAIRKRQSYRKFLPEPVPKETIEKILDTARWAPSAMNTQPWEFVVITGEKLDMLRAKIIDKLRNAEPMNPEHMVVGWPRESIYRKRQVELAKRLFAAMGIERHDKEKREKWLERGFRFFDAPAAIILLTDKVLGESAPLLDVGAVMQSICLAALHYGLGTCIEDQGVLYPEAVREIACIPDQKRIVIAIALGYPDPDFPANKVRSDREPIEKTTTWVGFQDQA